MNNPKIEKEKQHYFIQRAFNQTERLNFLLNDISLLNNIEDAGELFEIKPVVLKALCTMWLKTLKTGNRKNMKCKLYIDEDIVVNGNDSLLSSVFQNLLENSINYAGRNVTIEIKNYMEDKKFHYFSYSDTEWGFRKNTCSVFSSGFTVSIQVAPAKWEEQDLGFP